MGLYTRIIRESGGIYCVQQGPKYGWALLFVALTALLVWWPFNDPNARTPIGLVALGFFILIFLLLIAAFLMKRVICVDPKRGLLKTSTSFFLVLKAKRDYFPLDRVTGVELRVSHRTSPSDETGNTHFLNVTCEILFEGRPSRINAWVSSNPGPEREPSTLEELRHWLNERTGSTALHDGAKLAHYCGRALTITGIGGGGSSNTIPADQVDRYFRT